MIGLDTNVLVRLFSQDDPLQTERVERLMSTLSADSPGWVSIAALMEVAWVMTRVYRLGRRDVSRILDQLTTKEGIVVEQVETVRVALQIFDRSKISFADCLIAASARAAGCTKTVTFDHVAARDAGMELLA